MGVVVDTAEDSMEVDSMADTMAVIMEGIPVDIMEGIMADTIIMAGLSLASAQDYGQDIIHGITPRTTTHTSIHTITPHTPTTPHPQSMIHPLLL